MGGCRGIRCSVTADGARADFPDGSSVSIPAELLGRSSTLCDAVCTAEEVFTLEAPSEWLHAWVLCTAVLLSPSPNFDRWNRSQMSQCLLVRSSIAVCA